MSVDIGGAQLFSGYADWFFFFFDPYHIGEGLGAVATLAHGSNLFFWTLVYIIVRYEFPEPIVWLVHAIRPHVYDTPPAGRFAGAEPLVSVIIAGRNPGRAILSCIQSALEGNYRNVEVIYSDDYSTDDSVALARTFERSGRVRVFENTAHLGKQINLNIALTMARGEFIYQLDSDSQLEKDTIRKMLPYFNDGRVGAVCSRIRPSNVSATILTRFQSIEYALMFGMVQLWRAPLGAIVIVPGMGGMFRTAALRALGGYDPGLGEDTDITLRLRKAGWRLAFALQAGITTTVPTTLARLLNQRARWSRNMVKIRLRKHRDLATFRYGAKEALVYDENVLNRTLIPELTFVLLLFARFVNGSDAPQIVAGLYWFTTFMLAVKCLIANDLSGQPRFGVFWLILFYPLYRLPIWLTQVVQILRELLHIKPYHPYVPRRVWNQIPHR